MSESYLRLTYEAQYSDGDGQKVVIEEPTPDASMEDVWQLIRQLLLGAGFSPETVAAYMDEDESKPGDD